MTPETYLGFELVFVLPPILLLAALAYRRPTSTPRGREYALGVAVLVLLAVVYTTPWDNLLIERGVWAYGDGVVAGRVWAAPVGEYLFFVLQPILVALWLSVLDVPTGGGLAVPTRRRVAGAVAGVAVGAVGVGLVLSDPSTLYLGAILAWAGPVLAIQWAFGWPQLLRARRSVAAGIAVPTAYLWLADRYAIGNGLWNISGAHTVGIAPFGLPIEELVFFLVTDVFIVQGLVLYLWLIDGWSSVGIDVRTALPPRVEAAVPERDGSVRVTDLEEPSEDRDRRAT